MNNRLIYRNLFLWLISAVAVIPVVEYTLFHIWWSVIFGFIKTGWWGEPLVFISLSGIIIYLLYAFLVASILIYFYYKKSDRIIGMLTILVLLMIFIYGLGFLLSEIAVLPG